MLRKFVIASATIAALTLPAFAATTYYVGQSIKTHKCSVMTKKPKGLTMTQVGTMSYKTKAEATTAMKVAPECTAKMQHQLPVRVHVLSRHPGGGEF